MAPFRRRVTVTPFLGAARDALLRDEARRVARTAQRQALVLGPAFAGVLIAYDHRRQWFGAGLDDAVRVATVVALVILGWALARDIGRAVGPMLLGRLDPATAGTIGFLVRLAAVAIAIVVALHVAGLTPRTLALGGAFTAVVLGLGAQQTLGNLMAGMVLLSARPYRVGDVVRFQGGAVAGNVEGTVASLGLLYTTLRDGANNVMVPNSVVLTIAVIPLREPDSIDFVARLQPGVRLNDVQELLERDVRVVLREPVHLDLEGLDDDALTVRVTATPADPGEGAALVDQIVAAMDRVTHEHITSEHVLGRTEEHPARR